MQEKVKGFLEKGKQWWKNAAKKTKLLMGLGLLATVAVIAAVVIINLNRPYVTLFTELNQSDLSAIVSYLSDNGVTDYQIKDEDTILVPEGQEVQLKAQLLQEGYPSSGFAYSTYFDHVGTLTTESERNQLVLYELQDRTAAVIRCMEGVKDATVTLTPGEDNTYVLDSSNVVEASAYVMVTMKDGKLMDDTLAGGIRNLMSRTMQGLDVENISIVDSYGNTYTADDAFTDVQDSSTLKLQLEEQVNNTVRSHIMEVLIPLYGQENVRVSVNSTVNVDRTYTDSTDYTLEDWANDGSTGGEGIIGSKVYDNQILVDDLETAGGIVGSSSNADVPTYPETGEGDTEGQTIVGSSGENQYLVDQKKQQVEHVAGTVADVMVSVTINQDVAGGVGENDLYPHIARAAGIGSDVQEDKIHILIAPFYRENEAPAVNDQDTISMWVLYAAGGGLLLFLILLLIILLLVRRHKKKLARLAMQAEAEAMTPQAAAEGANIMEMQTEKSVELRKEVRRFAEENPEIAAQMVKSWLREGDSTE